MADIIRVKDPRGITVYCTEETWNQHILPSHEIMGENVESIKATISDPYVILESHDSMPPLDYREMYVKAHEGATYYGTKAKYTKVIVSVSGNSGEIITAYNANNIQNGSKGGAVYGPKNSESDT